jgi:hypothetical protein
VPVSWFFTLALPYEVVRIGIHLVVFTGVGISMADVSAIPIEGEKAEKLRQPVVLVNRNNYGIGGILKNYLSGNLVSHIQRLVIDFKMAPQFY